MTAHMPAHATDAYDLLAAGLRRLRIEGQLTPCQSTPAPWSPDAELPERAQAADACESCPLLDPCSTYADAAAERWGVWGAVDRTPKPASKTHPTTKESPCPR